MRFITEHDFVGHRRVLQRPSKIGDFCDALRNEWLFRDRVFKYTCMRSGAARFFEMCVFWCSGNLNLAVCRLSIQILILQLGMDGHDDLTTVNPGHGTRASQRHHAPLSGVCQPQHRAACWLRWPGKARASPGHESHSCHNSLPSGLPIQLTPCGHKVGIHQLLPSSVSSQRLQRASAVLSCTYQIMIIRDASAETIWGMACS